MSPDIPRVIAWWKPWPARGARCGTKKNSFNNLTPLMRQWSTPCCTYTTITLPSVPNVHLKGGISLFNHTINAWLLSTHLLYEWPNFRKVCAGLPQSPLKIPYFPLIPHIPFVLLTKYCSALCTTGNESACPSFSSAQAGATDYTVPDPFKIPASPTALNRRNLWATPAS